MLLKLTGHSDQSSMSFYEFYFWCNERNNNRSTNSTREGQTEKGIRSRGGEMANQCIYSIQMGKHTNLKMETATKQQQQQQRSNCRFESLRVCPFFFLHHFYHHHPVRNNVTTGGLENIKCARTRAHH